MPRTTSYSQRLERELGSLIEDLDVDAQRKRALRSRWLDQVLWLERKAARTRNLYYALRITTLVGALLVPALVSLTLTDDTLDRVVAVGTWVVSLVVAVSAALEQFFHFGDRWRSYRATVERLKAEGWLYLQLGGRYAANGSSHESSYADFAARTERLILADVDTFLTDVTVEREAEEGERKR